VLQRLKQFDPKCFGSGSDGMLEKGHDNKHRPDAWLSAILCEVYGSNFEILCRIQSPSEKQVYEILWG